MEDNQIFKVPQLPKPDQKTARQNQTDSNKAEFAHATKEENQQKQQQQQQPRGIPKLDYTAPENRTEPERPYYLQAIKEGKIVQEVELDVDQDYFVVGTLFFGITRI
ncbi:hypothetical protein AX774_g1163 [Zancudomyces culisetae]|uniref:Uncharacterized protein n=1 Tax=Zancudomyces culisetae TaxID=1213189 RepID=A0A1R1PWB9_ZANCU|nr:hypothetical protein AX774_g1163 [Zancudomyces culisetae]|eukprot:OMH85285.1 hypothetical protein AX774_g1163 [Zancudomyces culisetae]